MSPAQLSFREDPGALTAMIAGEVEFSRVEDLRAAILDRLASAELALILDLSAVTFLDSSAIQLLFDLQRTLGQRRQRTVVVLQAGASVRRTLGITDPDHLLPITATLEQALAGIQP